MAKKVFLEDKNITIEFPDDMPENEIGNIIKQEIYGQDLETAPEPDIDRIKEGAKSLWRGVQMPILSSPQAAANLVAEFGERFEEEPGKLDFVQAIAGNPHPFLYKKIKNFIGTRTNLDEGVVLAAQEVIKRNHDWLTRKDIRPEEGRINRFLFNLGSGVTTLGAAVGISVLTKSPHAAAALFGVYQKGNLYGEAREAGVEPGIAGELSTVGGVVEGSLEYIGLDFMLKKYGSKLLGLAIRSGSEALQEFSQTTGENLIVKLGGIDRARPIFEGAGESALIGFILGAGASTALDLMRNNNVKKSMIDKGLTEKQAEGIIEKINEEVRNEAGESIAQELNEMPTPEEIKPEPPAPSKGGEIAKLPSVTKIGKTVQEIISKAKIEKPGYLNKKLQEEYEKISSREEQREFLKQSIDTLEQEANFFKENKISTTKLAEYKDKIKNLPSSFKSSKSTAIGADELREIASGQIGRFETVDEVLDYAKDIADRLKSLKTEYKSLSPERITKKDITVVKQRMRDLEAGFKKGVSITKAQIKEFQSDLIRLINSADLLPKDRAKFLSTIKNVQTEKQFIKSLPQIEEKIRILSEKQEKIDLAKEITRISEKKIDPDYQEQIDEILERYDLKTRTEATKKLRLSRQEFFEREMASGNLDFIPQEFFKEFGKKTLDEMTLEEVEQLRDQISVLSTIGKTKSKLLSIRGEKDFQKRLEKIVETIYKTVSKVEMPLETGKPLVSNIDKTKLQKSLDMVSDYFAAHRKVEFITKDLNINQDVFETIQAGINKELISTEAVYTKLKDAFKIISNEMNKASTVLVKIQGVPVEMTREQMIGIVLNSGNEGNLQRLVNGNKFTLEQIEAVKKALTPKENQFVDKIFEIVGSLFPETVDVSKKLLGIKPKKVEGKYFPIVTDKDLSKLAQLREAETDLFQDIFQTTFLERYFTRGRIGGNAPVDLNVFKVLFSHIDAVTHFNSLAIPVRDIQKIISNPRFREAIIQTMNEATYEQFQPWLRSIANPKNLIPSGVIEKGAAILRHNATTAILGWRMSVSLLQAGSFTQTINEIGIKDSLNGIGLFLQGRSNAIDFIYSKSPIMKNRKMRFDREIRDWLKTKDALKITEGKKSYEEILFELIRGIDFITTAPTWLGAYHKQFDLTHNSDEASLFADGVVRRTQPSAAMENLAQIMKGSHVQKLFTSFMTHFANMHNQMVSALNKFKYSQDHPLKKLSTFARSMWWLWLAPALLSGLVRGGYNVKDWRKFAQEIVAYPFSGMMLVRDVTNSVIKGFDFGAPPGLSGFKELSYAIKGKEARTKIKHGVKSVGMLTGKIPTQAVDTAEGIIDLMSGQTDDWRRLIWSESALEDVNKGLFKYEKKSEL